jgi:hypothetical protein
LSFFHPSLPSVSSFPLFPLLSSLGIPPNLPHNGHVDVHGGTATPARHPRGSFTSRIPS